MDKRPISLEVFLTDKFRSIDNKFAAIDNKFASIDVQLASLDAKVTSLDAKVTSLDAKVTSLDARVTSLDADLRANNNLLLFRVIASRENELRKHRNRAAIIIDVHANLSPLLDVNTVTEIAEFPRDLRSLYEMDVFTIRRIFEALQMPFENMDLVNLREGLRRVAL